MESEYLRTEELLSLEAIFPEGDFVIESTSGSIDIPINLDHEVDIIYIGNPPQKIGVKNLPPLRFEFNLPPGYPDVAPEFEIIPDDLSIVDATIINRLRDELTELWDSCHDLVMYTMIDYLREEASRAFDIQFPFNTEMLFILQNIQRCNKQILLNEFNDKTYSCNICLDDFKGSHCLQFENCGHVFCKNCLGAYFKSCIVSGEVEKVHCSDYECNKRHVERQKAVMNIEGYDAYRNFFDIKEEFIKPLVPLAAMRELVDETLIQRYQELYKRRSIEILSRVFPGRVTECAREVCKAQIFREQLNENLVICQKCQYTFCFACRRLWHGDIKACRIQADSIPIAHLDLWLNSAKDSPDRKYLALRYGGDMVRRRANDYLMDKLFNEAINEENSTLKRCPNCSVVIQRSDGCNKMICNQCATAFCNLCGVYLDRNDPYLHFNDKESPCYNRLFDGLIGIT